MTDSGNGRRRRSGGGRAAAVAWGLIVLVLGVVAAGQARARAFADVEAALSRDVAPVAAAVADVIDRAQDDAVASVARSLAADGTTSGAGVLVEDDVVPAAIVARDGGMAELVGPRQLDGSLGPETFAVLVPVYEQGRTITVTPPRSTAERRRSSAGVVAVDRSADLARVAASAAGTDLAVDLIGPGEQPVGDVWVASVVGDPILGLRVAGVVDAPGRGASGFVLLVSALAAAGVAATIDRSGREIAVASAARHAADRDLETVAKIVPVVQQSLEVGDVLPALSVAMMDAFGLRGVAVHVRRAGEEVELFSARSGSGSSGHHLPVVELALDRGNRRLGTLRIEPTSPLSERQQSLLDLLSDMVAGSLANAALYDQQQAAVDRLREVDELKTVFLATASHELRTPITAISGFAGLLHSSWDRLGEDERKHFAGRIVANAEALDQLITQLLDFSRMEAGRLDKGAALDLTAAMEDMRVRVEGQVQDHDLRMSVDRGLWVRGTQAAIERIVSNLVGNAAKFSPSGSHIDVSVRAVPSRGEGSTVDLVVDDEGPGVAEQDRTRIFERFFRGSGEEAVRTRGAGMGLAIVSDFVAALDGAIEVTESPGGGARFRVSLPMIDPPAEPADQPDTDPVPEQPEASSAQ